MSVKQRQILKEKFGQKLAERMAQKVTSPPLFELMAEIEERHPKQADFITSPARHLAMVGGISSGKSQGGAMRGLLASYGWIGNERIETPNLGIITAPTYPMLRDSSIRTFKEVARNYIPPNGHNKSDGIITLKNGSEILLRSASDAELLRGPNLSWWWGDEGAMYGRLVRQIMVGRLRQFGVLGWDFNTTTPKGRNHIWQVYERDHQASKPELASVGWRMIRVHSRDNGFVSAEFYDELEDVYHGDFALQELAGEFVAFEGLIYHLFSREKHVMGSMPVQFARIVCGVDWGYTNPGVMLVVGFDGDGRAYVVEEVYERRRRIEEWAVEAARLRNKWGVETFYCDPSEPDYIRALNAQAGVTAVGANNSVNPGIQAVQGRLVVRGDGKARLVVHPDCGNVITEFEQYQWASGRDGVLRDVVNKSNDHAMDALRYVIMSQDGGYKTTVTVGNYVN